MRALITLLLAAIVHSQPLNHTSVMTNLTPQHQQDIRYYDGYTSSLQFSCLRNGSRDRPCTPWSYCDSVDGKCKCPNDNIDYILECNQFGYIDAVLNCNCVTYDEENNITEAGYCIYNCGYQYEDAADDPAYSLLPSNILDWNEKMCGRFNRTGTLCGKCIEGQYPLAYSFDMTCTTCTGGQSNWWKYLLSAFIPLTCFYIIVLLFKINIPSSQLQGFVFFSQIVSSPVLARLLFIYLKQKSLLFDLALFFGSLYGFWNLDFFRLCNLGICLQTNTLATLSLDLAVAVYPLLLMAVTYLMIYLYDCNFRILVVMWKPFNSFFSVFQRKWEIRTSTVDAFATFLVLSNVKFVIVCFDLLVPIRVYQFAYTPANASSTLRLYCDATILYFGQEHLPYAILAILVLFFFVIFPTVILLLYPFRLFHKCLNIIPQRWQIFLHTFVDSFQGCYKDGTEPGTRDYRWFSALPFILRFNLIIIYTLTLTSPFIIYCSMVLVITAMITIVIDPYKAHLSHFSHHFVMFILFLASVCVSLTGVNLNFNRNDSVIFFILISAFAILPLLCISVLILHWIIIRRKFGLECIRRIKAWRQDYSLELMNNY